MLVRGGLGSPILAVFVWTAFAPGASADAVGPIPPCAPGTSRGGLISVSGGHHTHRAPPPCEPTVCVLGNECAADQICRLDAHCITTRDVEVSVPMPSHGAPLGSGAVTLESRRFDLGRCTPDGACPPHSDCLEVATCRAEDEVDDAVLAGTTTNPAGSLAHGAWAMAHPRAPSTVAVAPTEVAPPSATAPRRSATAPTSEAPPAPETGCGCRAARPRFRSPLLWPSALLVLLLARQGRRALR